MDENKVKRLRVINYRIRGCGVCKFGRFLAGSEWGTCGLLTYEHQKHSDSNRALSIHKNGECIHYESANIDLEGFKEFLKSH